MEKAVLIEAIKENAKYFLEEAGEFFPFAVCVNDEDQFVPIYLDDEEEFEDDESMIEELKFCVSKAIEEESFTIGAIAFDTIVTLSDTEQNAIRVLFLKENNEITAADFIYSIKNKKLNFS
ncbi:MAG: hypothetical protein IPP27_03145 [Bacteroidetes bacterium]|nr:hypothetical protein [Bacteroidota bacterium]MBP6427019.1 hypothetical protein [Bacteroidia bacterium]MBK7570287.1 hypothetical protein [Bacteroidota bacterium]MBK8363574.1 hypothetical protein [Bacteroidota bacterium]MBK9414657.1 hypothetical protein [Bacteroidota bacterium]